MRRAQCKAYRSCKKCLCPWQASVIQVLHLQHKDVSLIFTIRSTWESFSTKMVPPWFETSSSLLSLLKYLCEEQYKWCTVQIHQGFSIFSYVRDVTNLSVTLFHKPFSRKKCSSKPKHTLSFPSPKAWLTTEKDQVQAQMEKHCSHCQNDSRLGVYALRTI